MLIPPRLHRTIAIVPVYLLVILAGCGGHSSPAVSRVPGHPTAANSTTSSVIDYSSNPPVLGVMPPPVSSATNPTRPARGPRSQGLLSPLTFRVSVTSDGLQVVNGADYTLEQGSSSISDDGSYVAFASNSATLVAGDTNTNFDVFVRMTCLNSANCTPATTRVSLAADGSQLSGGGNSASISGDGRYVAFSSSDPRIDPTNTQHILVRDTCTGVASNCTPTTIVASLASDGSLANSFSYNPRISRNGRYVVFGSRASNLVAGTANIWGDVYVRDTCLGVTSSCSPSTIRVDSAPDGSPPNNDGVNSFAISGDARYVAFLSDASNLVANDNNNLTDIFVRDTCVDATSCTPSTTLVSVDSRGGPLTAINALGSPAISGNGRYVVFPSTSELQPGGSAVNSDLFLRDTCAGAANTCVPSTTKITIAPDGSAADGSSFYPSVSGDGRYIAFVSGATNLVASDTNNVTDIFVRDTCGDSLGCTPTTMRLSVDSTGAQANNSSTYPAITFDGNWVSFDSTASNLVTGDTNAEGDVFVGRVPF